MSPKRVEMIVEVALEIGTFVYRVPEEPRFSRVEIGSLVRVPLKTTKTNGWIVKKSEKLTPLIDYGQDKNQNLEVEIKDILGICWSTPLISSQLIELGKWMAGYYQSSLGAALNLMVPAITTTSDKSQVTTTKSQVTSKRTGIRGKLPLGIKEALEHKKFKSILLYGANRREIYLQTIDTALSYGLSAIFLVPEIKLTSEIFSLFQKKFGNQVALLHSGLKKDERWAEWLRIKEGNYRVVVGTMSAVFAPVHNLGVIIVDEEQDTSYKSEKHPRYSAPVVGAMRAKIEKCLYIAGSATPSIEAFYDTEKKKSVLIHLVNPKKDMKVFVVDMRKEMDTIFSNLLKRKLKEYIANHKKILLFLNRRGFSSFILCEDCGYIPKCHNCGISLTYHRQGLVLKCHSCGYSERAIGYCPQCKGTNLSYKGVGTARVEKAFRELFPNVNIFRLDLDVVSAKSRLVGIFNSFIKGEIQVLLGTQILAKPIEFPNVGLVGIISADTGLNLPDFRAPEHTFSLFMRLIEKGEESILQTHNPQHRVFKYLVGHDYLNFYKQEKLARKEHNYPPYSHLVRILIESHDEAQGQEKINKIASLLKEMRVEFLGPSPCHFEHKKGKYRVHLLLKVKDIAELQFTKILPSGTIIDVDPVDFL